jgi:hypothetical protein
MLTQQAQNLRVCHAAPGHTPPAPQPPRFRSSAGHQGVCALRMTNHSTPDRHISFCFSSRLTQGRHTKLQSSSGLRVAPRNSKALLLPQHARRASVAAAASATDLIGVGLFFAPGLAAMAYALYLGKGVCFIRRYIFVLVSS